MFYLNCCIPVWLFELSTPSRGEVFITENHDEREKEIKIQAHVYNETKSH